MSWFIVALVSAFVVLLGVNIVFVVMTRRQWTSLVVRHWKRARRKWLHLPRWHKPVRGQEEASPHHMDMMWTSIRRMKVFLAPRIQDEQLTPLALMRELRSLERGLTHLARKGQGRVGGSDVEFYLGWLTELEQSVSQHVRPTTHEQELRAQAKALLDKLKKRMALVGASLPDPSLEDILPAGAIALLEVQMQDAKVPAAVCLSYAQFVDQKIQHVEAKDRKPAQPLTHSPHSPSASAPASAQAERQPLVRPSTPPQMIARGQASSADSDAQIPPAAKRRPRMSF